MSTWRTDEPAKAKVSAERLWQAGIDKRREESERAAGGQSLWVVGRDGKRRFIGANGARERMIRNAEKQGQ